MLPLAELVLPAFGELASAGTAAQETGSPPVCPFCTLIVGAGLSGRSWKLLAAGCCNCLGHSFLNFRNRRIRCLEYLFLNFRNRRIRCLEYLFLTFRSRRIRSLCSSAERSRRLMSFAFRSILRRHCR